MNTKSGNKILEGFSDADWAGDRDTRRSTSGNAFILSDAAIIWFSRKQSSVALSTIEAEYMALSIATQEAVWLRQLIDEMSEDKSITIWEDNQEAIFTANNPVFHKKTKHIHIQYHYVREAVECGEVDIKYCPPRG